MNSAMIAFATKKPDRTRNSFSARALRSGASVVDAMRIPFEPAMVSDRAAQRA
jgi:hypothetical protein